jgi:hypothetical protein
VRKPSTPPPPLPERRSAARLVEALHHVVHRYATASRLAPVAVLGAISWVLGCAIGAAVRDTDADLEAIFALVMRSMRKAALGEVCRRPSGTVH